MADPDLELRGGGGELGYHLLALLAFLPSAISSFFCPRKKGRGVLDPPLCRIVEIVYEKV